MGDAVPRDIKRVLRGAGGLSEQPMNNNGTVMTTHVICVCRSRRRGKGEDSKDQKHVRTLS